MTQAIQDSRKVKPTLILGLLFIVFMGPMLFAWGMYKRADNLEFSYVNNGDLVLPPVQIEEIHLTNALSKEAVPVSELLGHWSLVYLMPDICSEGCLQNIYFMRQLQTALGKDAHRLQRISWFLPHQSTALGPFLKENYPDMQQNIVNGDDFKKHLSGILDSAEQIEVGSYYIIDPNGNLMMAYAGDMETKAIMKDIKRLLKVSQIG